MYREELQSMFTLSYQERLTHINLPTLVCRKVRGDMIEVYRILQNIYYGLVSPKWEAREGFTRGHSKKLYKRRAKTKPRRHFFTSRTVDA